ncbi:MAG: FAD-binding oxidoreductase [Ginsengibacter sp.]
MIYDSIIIGAGLIGSAAAKYLSKSQQKIALIGPDEFTALQEGVVFASHYDQSRIQRIIGKDETWTMLNQQSVNEYAALENEAGIHFHSGVGCLYVNPYGSDNYLEKVPEQAKRFNQNYQLFQHNEFIHSSFPPFNFPSTSMGVFESFPSGYINPRLLIKAQLSVFKKNGGEVVNDLVNEIGYANEKVKISTHSGKVYHSKKVLLAPGSFINFFNLLKRKLFLNLKSETTVWARVSEEEAQRLSRLPSLLYEINEPEIKNIYLVQPVQYPDGNYYVKMGANLPGDIFFKSLDEIRHWFKTESNNDHLGIMRDTLMKIIPSLSLEECVLKKCIVAFTKHGKPYIGQSDNGLYFAAGGNGYSAMCSDALGKIAATLLLEDEFPKEFLQEDSRPVFVD